MTTQVKLKNVRAAFVNVFKPSAVGDGDPAYNMAVLFPPGHPAEKIIEDALLAEANAKWGPKGADTLKSLKKAGKVCIKDGDSKDYDGYAGNLFINARNEMRPRVVDANGSQLSAEDGRPYSGCYVDVIFDIWPQDNNFGKRINASLAGVQFRKHGEAFGGGGTPLSDDAFESIEDEVDDDLV